MIRPRSILSAGTAILLLTATAEAEVEVEMLKWGLPGYRLTRLVLLEPI